MRRAVLALGGTVAGLAALFSYKTHVPTVTALNTPITPTESAASPSSAPTPTMKPPATKPSATKPVTPRATKTKAAPATSAPRTTTPTTQAPPPPTHTAAPPPPKPSGTFSGGTVNTQYGPVQVTITVSDGKITAASDPDGGDSIGQNAIYQLNPEVVQAQSASIQAVSGATYTSDGYIQSLQQAIDSAGL
jgi:uncharacterized protein with FMN-binding domain